MGIADQKYKRFTAKNVARAPLKAGVFALYGADRSVVFFGQAKGGATTLRTQLVHHLTSEAFGATRYKREACRNPASRLRALLDEHRAAHGRMPRGNA
jgi:hypothetical protein